MNNKKDAILQNALKMFLEYDYAGTSISKIASSVGISKSTFFNYFKTKDELFNEVFLMCKKKASERDFGLKEALDNFEEYYSFYIENIDGIRFLNRFESSEYITDDSRAKGIAMNINYYNDIVEGQKNGTITNLPPIYLCLMSASAIIKSVDYVMEDGKINSERVLEIKKFIEKILFTGS